MNAEEFERHKREQINTLKKWDKDRKERMSKRTIDHSGNDEFVSIQRERLILRERWTAKTGEYMPVSIASLPVDLMRRAVERTEAGETVFVPRESAAVAGDDPEGSLMDWDGHGAN